MARRDDLLVAITGHNTELDSHASQSQRSEIVPVDEAYGIPSNAMLLAVHASNHYKDEEQCCRLSLT